MLEAVMSTAKVYQVQLYNYEVGKWIVAQSYSSLEECMPYYVLALRCKFIARIVFGTEIAPNITEVTDVQYLSVPVR